MGKYVLLWLPMVILAIANGVVREAWYGKHVSELPAHQLSTLSGMVLLGLYMWAVLRLWPPATASRAWATGLLWLGLTVAFEFLFGHYAAGHSWSRLLQNYRLWEGRLWVLIPLWVTMAPYLFFRLQR
ncbi:MAG: hypothetical protein FJ135_02555 [Deltaproteobacteria bacterium]|nr:hypothetical protein [Deltaproteobacteria bacterium]